MKKLQYKDTRNYASIDVIKGIDLLTGKKVLADDLAPEGYEAMPKCKFCKNYKVKDNYLGTCGCSTNGFMAYGEMKATTCQSFTKV